MCQECCLWREDLLCKNEEGAWTRRHAVWDAQQQTLQFESIDIPAMTLASKLPAHLSADILYASKIGIQLLDPHKKSRTLTNVKVINVSDGDDDIPHRLRFITGDGRAESAESVECSAHNATAKKWWLDKVPNALKKRNIRRS